MVELLAPKATLSAAIHEFSGKARLPKGITRKAAAVFFKTEEFERRLDSLKGERKELEELHEYELELLQDVTPPMLERMKVEHARREGRITATHELLSQMETSYNSAHKKMNDFILDEVVTEDRFVEAKAQLLLSAPPEFKDEAMGDVRKDDAAMKADYAKTFDGILDSWKQEFSEHDKKYAELRAEYPPEKPLEADLPEPPKPAQIIESGPAPEIKFAPVPETKPAPVPETTAAPIPEKPAQEMNAMPALAKETAPVPEVKKYRADVEKVAERIMREYSLPSSEHDMLCELFLRLAGEKDAQDSFLRVESLYETTASMLKQIGMGAPENLHAVAANIGRGWDRNEGEWRAKSMEVISLLADAEEEDKPLLLALFKDPTVSASAVIFWFELHYGELEPHELDAVIMEDKMKHPAASKMIDGFHSLMAGFAPGKDRLLVAKIDLPRDREVVLVFEIEKIENEIGGCDYCILPTPSAAEKEAKFEGHEFERLLATPGMQGIGHSHPNAGQEEFKASELRLMVENASIPHLLLNAESWSAQLYNPRVGRIVRLETIDL